MAGRNMPWTRSVYLAIKRILKDRDSKDFTRKELMAKELENIMEETGCAGKTPEKTLTLTLQRLTEEETIIKTGRGKYRFRG